jgi:hypothetical protein
MVFYQRTLTIVKTHQLPAPNCGTNIHAYHGAAEYNSPQSNPNTHKQISSQLAAYTFFFGGAE